MLGDSSLRERKNPSATSIFFREQFSNDRVRVVPEERGSVENRSVHLVWAVGVWFLIVDRPSIHQGQSSTPQERGKWPLNYQCGCAIAIKICLNVSDLIVARCLRDPSHCEKAAHKKWKCIQQMEIWNLATKIMRDHEKIARPRTLTSSPSRDNNTNSIISLLSTITSKILLVYFSNRAAITNAYATGLPTTAYGPPTQRLRNRSTPTQ